MATYKNLCGWHPIPADCTRIEGGNLSGVVFPTDREIVVDGAIYIKGEYPSNVIFLPSCTAVENTPIDETPIDPFDAIKEQAKNKLLEVKPLAYENPLAVKVALSEAFTPEEFSGVMEAQ